MQKRAIPSGFVSSTTIHYGEPSSPQALNTAPQTSRTKQLMGCLTGKLAAPMGFYYGQAVATPGNC